jgi:hypothetical protein
MIYIFYITNLIKVKKLSEIQNDIRYKKAVILQKFILRSNCEKELKKRRELLDAVLCFQSFINRHNSQVLIDIIHKILIDIIHKI